MPQDVSSDVASIREWLAKEPHLPLDLDDFMIKKFLHSCYGSLEKTKKCIDRFYTTRATMSEVYTSRDPTSDKMKTAFSITSVTTYKAGENEILIHQLDDPALDKFVFYDALKSFSIQCDYWLKNHDFFPEGQIIILDIKDYSLKIIPKVNIMFFRDFLIFLLEGMPVRVKQVHVVNCPTYVDRLYALVKPALPADICNINYDDKVLNEPLDATIQQDILIVSPSTADNTNSSVQEREAVVIVKSIKFHTTQESLHKAIDKKYLPQEYGGDAPSMKQEQRDWVKRIVDDRKTFLNDNLWKADIKKKPKNNAVDNSMNGSFRTLSID